MVRLKKEIIYSVEERENYIGNCEMKVTGTISLTPKKESPKKGEFIWQKLRNHQ